MSESNVPGVYKAISAVAADMAQLGISKGRRNQQQGYSFRGIDDVLNALAPSLVRHGLVILPRCLGRTIVEHQSKGGGTLFYVTVEVEFDFVCIADGSKHTIRTFGEAMDSADKATNKAMSAAYKYSAIQTFCIPTEGDNDADARTHERAVNTETGEEAEGLPEGAEPQHGPQRETEPPAQPQADVPLPKCPVCGGKMWDNRTDRAEDEAAIEAGTRTKTARPAWKCRDKACKGTYWPADWREKDEKKEPTPAAPAPVAERPTTTGAPKNLEDARARMKALLDELKLFGFTNEHWKAVLFTYKAKSGNDLDEEQAFGAVAALMNQLVARKVEAAAKETEAYLEDASEEEHRLFGVWCRSHGIVADMWQATGANADAMLNYVRDMQSKRKEGVQ